MLINSTVRGTQARLEGYSSLSRSSFLPTVNFAGTHFRQKSASSGSAKQRLANAACVRTAAMFSLKSPKKIGKYRKSNRRQRSLFGCTISPQQKRLVPCDLSGLAVSIPSVNPGLVGRCVSLSVCLFYCLSPSPSCSLFLTLAPTMP